MLQSFRARHPQRTLMSTIPASLRTFDVAAVPSKENKRNDQHSNTWTLKNGCSCKVLMLVSNGFDPDPRVHAEAKSMVAHGYEVKLLAWDRELKYPAKEIRDGISIERIHLRSSHNRGATQAVFIAAMTGIMVARGLRRSFDVVHAHDFDTLPAAYALACLKRRPLVYDAHEDFVGMLDGFIPSWMSKVIHRAEDLFVRHVDLLITVGEKLRQDFERRGCHRSVVVGNWKVVSEFRLQPDVRLRVRRELQIPQTALVVSFIAQLGTERKIHELLKAISLRPSVHLIVAGTGPELPVVKNYARIHRNIHYLGFLDPDGVRSATWASDVVYYGFDTKNPNSKYSAPNKLFEALAAGKCLISGHFGEIEAIVNSTHCGILLSSFSEQQIVRALDDCLNFDRLRMFQQSAAHAGEATYNWAKAEEQLLSSYEELCDMKSNVTSVESARCGPVE